MSMIIISILTVWAAAVTLVLAIVVLGARRRTDGDQLAHQALNLTPAARS